MKNNREWSFYDVEQTLTELGGDLKIGLSKDEIQKRVEVYGENNLIGEVKTSCRELFVRQFTNVLIIILFIASAISFAIGEIGDAITIMVIIFLNEILGFVQEYKAENAIEALRDMLRPTCKALRDSKTRIIDAKSLVPGDVVYLEIGDKIPADLRILETPLAQTFNMGGMGTSVVNGRATGIVVATGMNTEFGKIALMMRSIEAEPTPLQKKLGVLGKQLGFYSVAISIMVALLGWLLGKGLVEMFLTGVALAVVVVPEGLPAVATITLALGIKAMAKEKALLRNLQAAETLGAVTTVCTDKTGTLTQKQMTVNKIWLASKEVEVTGSGYDPAGHFESDGVVIDYKNVLI